jgi:glycosyltransferase involved in cell wall biosynthesis
MMMEIDYINGRKTEEIYGISKYNLEIRRRQEGFIFENIEYSIYRQKRHLEGLIKGLFYPLIIRKSIKENHIKHITSQDLAFVSNIITLQPLIITSFDIIPWSYYNKHSFYWRMNLKGLRYADQVITISHFSKQELVDHAKVDEDKIDVLYCGVDHQRFKNLEKVDELRELFGFNENEKIILYVGSEEPRKNFPTVIHALNKVKKQVDNVKLLKVGSANWPGSRDWAVSEIQSLGLQKDVVFLDTVSEDTLPKLYNIADVFVFPSLYEGFGLPPLEAMACGTPVVCSATTSLPEVVGDAAVIIDPLNSGQISDAVVEILANVDLQAALSRKGQARAQMFDWERPAQQMTKIYKKVGETI